MKSWSLAASGVLLVTVSGVTMQARAQPSGCISAHDGLPKFGIDAHVAVGRSHVVVTDHDWIRVYNKCGDPIYNIVNGSISPDGHHLNTTQTVNGLTTTGFFHPAFVNPDPTAGGDDSTLNDTRVIYDRHTRRFFLVCGAGDIPGTPAQEVGILVAASEVDDATQWPAKRHLPTGCAEYGVYYDHLVTVSTDTDDLWFVTNSINTTCGPSIAWHAGYVNKSAFIGGTHVPKWSLFSGDFTQGGFLAIKQSFDGTPQYALDARRSTLSGPVTSIALYYIKKDGSGNVVVSPSISLPVPASDPLPTHLAQPHYAGPTHPAGAYPVEVEAPLSWHSVYQDGYVWTAHIIGSGVTNPRSLIRWYKIRMNNWGVAAAPQPAIEEWGTIDPEDEINDPAVRVRSAFTPTISVHANNRVDITFNVVGPNPGQYLSVYSSTKCPGLPMSPPVKRYQHPATITNISGVGYGRLDYGGSAADPVVPGRTWFHHGLVPGKPLPSGPVYQPSRVGRYDVSCSP